MAVYGDVAKPLLASKSHSIGALNSSLERDNVQPFVKCLHDLYGHKNHDFEFGFF